MSEVARERHLWARWPGHRDSDIDFYLSIVQSRREVVRPHVVLLYQGYTPKAMLVGRIEQRKMDFRLGYLSMCRVNARVLAFVAGALRGDPSPDNSKIFMEEILRALRAGESDVAVLNSVDASSPICKAARSMPKWLSRDTLARVHTHWKMALSETVEDTHRLLSKNLRGQIRRKARRLFEAFDGRVRVSCFQLPAQVEQVMKQAEEIARKTYQRGLGVGFHINEEIRNRLLLQAAKGWLRGYVLYIADRPSAFWLGSLYGGVFYSEYLGHDPSYDKYSIGTFLTTRVIESLCEERAAGIDFGPGDSRYKREFGNSQIEETNIHIFAPRLAGYRLNALHTCAALIDRIARSLLNRGNLHVRVRKIWRDHRRTNPLSVDQEPPRVHEH